jgi:hypothetical protein
MNTSFTRKPVALKSLAGGAMLCLAAFGASAAEDYKYDFSVHSTKTRAEVRAELEQAIANGEVGLGRTFGEGWFYRPQLTGSTKTRAEVKAELEAAIVNGEVGHGRTFGEGWARRPQIGGGTRTRAEVRAELERALGGRGGL